jgi:putative tryptophan/tyrosine transport system substrate-binding protein
MPCYGANFETSGLQMRRRKFIAGLGSAATWPLVVRAQQRVIESYDDEFAACRRGLAETGHVEGRNVVFEYRTAENHFDRLPALADDLGDFLPRPMSSRPAQQRPRPG